MDPLQTLLAMMCYQHRSVLRPQVAQNYTQQCPRHCALRNILWGDIVVAIGDFGCFDSSVTTDNALCSPLESICRKLHTAVRRLFVSPFDSPHFWYVLPWTGSKQPTNVPFPKATFPVTKLLLFDPYQPVKSAAFPSISLFMLRFEKQCVGVLYTPISTRMRPGFVSG